MAYMALSDPLLSSLYVYDLNKITKEDYIKLMKEMYKYVKPHETAFAPISNLLDKNVGIPTLGLYDYKSFIRGVEHYAKDKGVNLDYEVSSSNAKFNSTVDFIREGLQNNHPIAMLDLFDKVNMKYDDPVQTGNENQHLEMHWVTITGMVENKSTGNVTLEVSTWGGKASINLNDIYDNKNWNDKLFPSRFIYFKPK